MPAKLLDLINLSRTSKTEPESPPAAIIEEGGSPPAAIIEEGGSPPAAIIEKGGSPPAAIIEEGGSPPAAIIKKEPSLIPDRDRALKSLAENDIVQVAHYIKYWVAEHRSFTMNEILAALGIEEAQMHFYGKGIGQALRLLSYTSRRSEIKGQRIRLWEFRKPDDGETPLQRIEREGPPARRPLLPWLDKRRKQFTLDEALVAVYGTDDVYDHQRLTMDLKLQKAGCKKAKNLDTEEVLYYPPGKG